MKARRLRLWLITGSAALIVLAATLSALFRTAVAVAPGYRDQLQAWVGRTLEHPARIGSMNLLWHGFQPVLQLDDVQLLSAEGGAPMITASRLRIGMGLRYLLMGHVQPSDLTLSGLQLVLLVDDEGHLHLQGLGASPGQTDYQPVLQALSRFDALHLDGCRLTLRYARLDPQPMLFDNTRIDLQRHGEVLVLKASLRPPRTVAQSLTVEATSQGDIQDPAQWQIDGSATVEGLSGELPWLRRQLADGSRIDLRDARLTAGGQWLKGQWTSLRGELRATSIEGRQGSRVVAQARNVQIAGTAVHHGEAWDVAMAPLRLRGLRGDWPDNRWRARLHQGDAGLDGVEIGGDYLRVDDLASWLALVKAAGALAPTLSAASGEISDFSLQWAPPDPTDMDVPGQAQPQAWYRLSARFGQLGLVPTGERPGIAGLSGRLSATPSGGTVQLDAVPLTVTLPQVMEAPVLMDAMSGPLSWEQEPGGWRVACPAFDFRLGGTQGNGHFDLSLPRASEASPSLNLQLDFQSEDAATLKPLLPKTWGPNTRAWLRRAIVRAPIPHAHLELNGPLADFPFVARPTGHWSLDLALGDADLAFAPDWTSLDRLKARVRIAGEHLEVDAESGNLGGAHVDQAHAVIPDFKGETLTIDGLAHGDARDFYRVLRASPLKKQLSGLLDHTDMTGATQLALHLDVPLDDHASGTHAHGTVRLDDAVLDVKGLDEPIRDLTGMAAFGPNGVDSDSLRARFHDLPLAARIVPDPASPEGRVAIDVDVPATPADHGMMARYVPDWILGRLSGQAHWIASLPLSGRDSGVLTLSSDLKGLGSRLPSPLGKKVDELRPMTLRIAGDDSAPLRLLLGFPDGRCAEVCVALRFAQVQSALQVRGIEGHFGNDAVPQAAADGIVVTGHPQALDIAPWLGMLGGGFGGDAVPSMRRLDIAADSLLAGDYRLRATHLVVAPAANPNNGWTLSADGDGARGTLVWLPANGGQLRGRFDHVHLEPLATPDAPATPAAGTQEPGDAFDPGHSPTLDLSVDQVESAGINLGHFHVATSRVANGQSIDSLRLDGGVVTLDSHGSWRRTAGQSTADNQFSIDSEDFGQALKALGYAPSVTGHAARLSGQLQWPDNPSGIDFRLATGTVKLEVDNGSLTAVNPGAGRMLGLFNLYALPRRLTLNFSDVVSKGLGFDKLMGTFALDGGNAMTQDMRITAPSLRMEIHGRIGLVARDYDEHVTVYPGLSTGAVIGAGLAGGPAGVAIALVAQQLFNKPLETLTRFSYHLTGGWDNPQIKRGDSETAVPASQTPAPATTPEAAAPG